MKTKLIAGLTALSVLAFPISALAAQQAPQAPQTPAPANTAVCTVAGCRMNGNHTHAQTQEHAAHSAAEHAQGGGQSTGAYRRAHH